jgi:hypothetical protein
MLFIVGLVIVSVGVVIIPRMRLPSRVNAAPLGWMSNGLPNIAPRTDRRRVTSPR